MNYLRDGEDTFSLYHTTSTLLEVFVFYLHASTSEYLKYFLLHYIYLTAGGFFLQSSAGLDENHQYSVTLHLCEHCNQREQVQQVRDQGCDPTRTWAADLLSLH